MDTQITETYRRGRIRVKELLAHGLALVDQVPKIHLSIFPIYNTRNAIIHERIFCKKREQAEAPALCRAKTMAYSASIRQQNRRSVVPKSPASSLALVFPALVAPAPATVPAQATTPASVARALTAVSTSLGSPGVRGGGSGAAEVRHQTKAETYHNLAEVAQNCHVLSSMVKQTSLELDQIRNTKYVSEAAYVRTIETEQLKREPSQACPRIGK